MKEGILRSPVDILGRVLAFFLYMLGVSTLLYVSVYLPYAHPELDRSEIAWDNLRLWVPALVWVLIASVSWAVVHISSGEASTSESRDEEGVF